MTNIAKSMFVPPNMLGKDELSISLGVDFYRDIYDQGFDGSGKYYIIAIDEYGEFDMAIFVIDFDAVTESIGKKILKISIPIECECDRQSFLFPYHGKVVHSVQYKASEDENIAVDLYYLDIFDLLKKSNDTIVIDKTPDITLNYDKERFNKIYFERCSVDKKSSTLLLQGYCRYREDRWYYRYRPEICIDVLHVSKMHMVHLKRVECDLEIFSSGIYHPMKILYSKQRLYFSAKSVKTYEIFEVDLNGKIVFSYILSWDSDLFNYQSLLQSGEGDTVIVIFYGISGIFCMQRLLEGHIGSSQEFKLPVNLEITKVDFPGCPILKFGHLLIPLLYEPDKSSTKFFLFDLNSKQISSEINVNPNDEMQTFSLNWNLKELVYTGFYVSNHEEGGHDEMLFKAHKIVFPNIGLTLKCLARLAVLTSFSEEEIIKQNLPESLFRFLGIEK
uniref:Uncharacterized protein n=1 Tax=Clytia hemisphaerica TaxID=252671 RepID=A0A7M5XLX3_9CNID